MPVTQKFTRERRCKQYVSQQPQHCTRLMATLPSRVLELHGICMGSGQDRPAPLLFVKTKKLPMTTVVLRCGDEPLQFNNRPDLKLLLRRRRRHSNLAKLCQISAPVSFARPVYPVQRGVLLELPDWLRKLP
jgi:hypothetical protein